MAKKQKSFEEKTSSSKEKEMEHIKFVKSVPSDKEGYWRFNESMVALEKGQKLLLKTPGGGGYGNPKERDANKVVEDVRLGYVSAKSALQDYFCHLDDKGMLDLEETNKLREAV